jgi:hypothetical protein
VLQVWWWWFSRWKSDCFTTKKDCRRIRVRVTAKKDYRQGQRAVSAWRRERRATRDGRRACASACTKHTDVRLALMALRVSVTLMALRVSVTLMARASLGLVLP